MLFALCLKYAQAPLLEVLSLFSAATNESNQLTLSYWVVCIKAHIPLYVILSQSLENQDAMQQKTFKPLAAVQQGVFFMDQYTLLSDRTTSESLSFENFICAFISRPALTARRETTRALTWCFIYLMTCPDLRDAFSPCSKSKQITLAYYTLCCCCCAVREEK